MHYLDDFTTFGSSASQQCQTNCLIMSSICELLGIPLATEKTEGPCTCLVYLGFLLDIVSMSVSVPKEKLEALEDLLISWLRKKHCTKHELESLIGKLHHASAVVKSGHSFLRCMSKMQAQSSPSHQAQPEFSFRPPLVAHIFEGLERHFYDVNHWAVRAICYLCFRCIRIMGVWSNP